MAGEGGHGLFSFLALLIISALLGSLLGELLGLLVSQGTLHDMLVKGYPVGLEPPIKVDLKVLTFSFGATLKLNLCSFIGMAIGILFFRK